MEGQLTHIQNAGDSSPIEEHVMHSVVRKLSELKMFLSVRKICSYYFLKNEILLLLKAICMDLDTFLCWNHFTYHCFYHWLKLATGTNFDLCDQQNVPTTYYGGLPGWTINWIF